MQNVVLFRVDDRLIHGQIMTAWTKFTCAKKIIIIDNKTASNPYLIKVLKLSVAFDTVVNVMNVQKGKTLLKKNNLKKNTIILVKNYFF